jgi:uncharacterized protein YecE (DUF72 family)
VEEATLAGMDLAPILSVDAAKVRVGTCSWADATLTKDSDWYPKRSMKAAERLAYYASKFSVVEIDSTYYFPPTPELSQSWVDRSPDGFVFDVKAWSLLTGHPTFPHSLWPDMNDAIRAEFRDKRNLYDKHLHPAALDECWERFRHSLEPLHEGGRLGGVLLQYPEWFGPKEGHRERILMAVEQLHPYPCFIEFRNQKWLLGEECDKTLSFLEDNGLPFVCVDEPQGFTSSMPPTLAVTSPLAVIRFHGHNNENWTKRGITAAERFRYLYDEAELTDWSARLREVTATSDEVHVLFNNCWQDYAVRNATSMAQLLTDEDEDEQTQESVELGSAKSF